MKPEFKAVVIGASAGGLTALPAVISPLNENFKIPVVIVQHLSADSDDYLVRHIRKNSNLEVYEAEDKMKPEKGCVYIAPPNYHLLIEEEGTFALSVSPPVNFSRPSIDVLFETAADAWREGLIGIVLTGANADGTAGAGRIKKRGGLVIVQDSRTAESETMPKSASKYADIVLPLDQIGIYLNNLLKENAGKGK